MAKQDFYDILGVSKSADADELKRAYRKLAMQFHPDRNPGDQSAEHKFKDINEAYDVLKDDQKRAAYDRFGHAAFENGSRGPGDFAGGFSGGFADIFEEMFGAMGGGGRRTQAGPTCQGSGQVIEKPCRPCGGQGRIRREKTLSVNIPPGVEDGTRIRLAGEGEVGIRGASAGDLYIFITVAPHRIFQRDGANIFCRVPISITTAALGGSIEVPSVDGSRARVTVPPGTQSGHQFRLRGKGMSVLRSPARGDMFIEAIVETPDNLNKRQQELLREFEKAGDHVGTQPESEGFFARVKEFFEDLRE